MTQFNLLVVGDKGVGKTTFIHSIHTNSFKANFEPSYTNYKYGVLNENTTRGPISIHLYDTDGLISTDNNNMQHYIQADAVIILFDLTSNCSYEHAKTKWYPQIRQVCSKIPILLVGNKYDRFESNSTGTNSIGTNSIGNVVNVDFHITQNLKYFETSSKTCLNIDKIVLSLMKEIKRDGSLTLVKKSDSNNQTNGNDYVWVS
jgi:GTP-binding nuclear protein Ran